MVGLSTAWFLQEHGVEVTVLDREGVAAGSSWGNAGWLTPGIATPLPEPAVLKYGLRAVLSPSSPVYVPPSADPKFLKFVTGFTRNSTMKAWKKAMGSLVPVNDLSLAELRPAADGGVQADTREAKSFLASYRTEPTSARPCSRRSSTSTPRAATSSSTRSPATRPAPSSRACPTRSVRPSCSRASGSSTRAPTSTRWPTR